MDKRELYAHLDIESPEEFEYFENLADFLECDEELEFADVAELFDEVDKDTLAQLCDNYFEEISGFVPGSQTEVFTIFENVRRAFVGMCRNCKEDENLKTKLAEELERFRRWYSIESEAYCTDLGTMEETKLPLRDAILASRLEGIAGNANKYEYDFSECMDYPLEEYIVSLGDMIAMGEEDESGGFGENDASFGGDTFGAFEN